MGGSHWLAGGGRVGEWGSFRWLLDWQTSSRGRAMRSCLARLRFLPSEIDAIRRHAASGRHDWLNRAGVVPLRATEDDVVANRAYEPRTTPDLIAKTEAYAVSRRQRKKVEMLFSHLKRILRLDRLRLRGPSGTKDEFLLAATAQNLRKLAKIIPLPAPVFVT